MPIFPMSTLAHGSRILDDLMWLVAGSTQPEVVLVAGRSGKWGNGSCLRRRTPQTQEASLVVRLGAGAPGRVRQVRRYRIMRSSRLATCQPRVLMASRP